MNEDFRRKEIMWSVCALCMFTLWTLGYENLCGYSTRPVFNPTFSASAKEHFTSFLDRKLLYGRQDREHKEEKEIKWCYWVFGSRCWKIKGINCITPVCLSTVWRCIFLKVTVLVSFLKVQLREECLRDFLKKCWKPDVQQQRVHGERKQCRGGFTQRWEWRV